MTRFDKKPGATSFAEAAIDQLGASQDNALMSSLSSNFAERRRRREAEALKRAEDAEAENARLRERQKAGELGWAAKLQMSPELRKLQEG